MSHAVRASPGGATWTPQEERDRGGVVDPSAQGQPLAAGCVDRAAARDWLCEEASSSACRPRSCGDSLERLCRRGQGRL